MKYYEFCTKNWRENAKNLVFGRVGKFLARFLAGFGEGIMGEGGGERGGIPVAKNDLGSAKNRVVRCQNLVFGRMEIFLAGFLAFWGSFWQITFVRIAGGPIKWAFVGNSGKCQKFSFWHFGMHFWQ